MLHTGEQVPTSQQKKVLNYGIWGAIAMRALFIGAGLLAIEKFRGVLVGFAGILIYSSYKV
jgi:predicted tellurium resistance membrane protein TerC